MVTTTAQTTRRIARLLTLGPVLGWSDRDTIRERKELESLAVWKLYQTEDEVRQKAQKAFRELAESQGLPRRWRSYRRRRRRGQGPARPDGGG
jgi:hypothetical protein